MKIKYALLAGALLLLAAATGRSQPVITSFILNGQVQTGNDSVHRYLRYSVSPGVRVYFTVTVSGGQPPLNYLWQLYGTNVPGQTTLALGAPGVELAPGDYTFIVTDPRRKRPGQFDAAACNPGRSAVAPPERRQKEPPRTLRRSETACPLPSPLAWHLAASSLGFRI